MSLDFYIEVTTDVDFKAVNIMGDVWAFGKDLGEIGRKK